MTVAGGVLAACAVLAPALPRRAAWPAALALSVVAEFALGVDLLPASAGDAVTGHPLLAVAGALALGALVVSVALVARRAPIAWILLLGLAAPLRLPIDLGSETANLLVPLYVVLAGGLCGLIGPLTRHHPVGRDYWRPAAAPLALAAIAALSCLSLVWTDDPDRAAVAAAFFYLPFALLCWLLAAGCDALGLAPAKVVRLLAVALLAVAALAGIVAIAQAAGAPLWWNRNLIEANAFARVRRVNALFYDPNVLARFAVVAALLWAALTAVGRGPLRLGAPPVRVPGRAVLLALVTVPGIVLSFSRSGALALVAGLAVIAPVVLGVRRVAVGALVAIVVGGVAVGIGAAQSDAGAPLSEGRSSLVSGGLALWRADPVIGSGLGSFEIRYAARVDADPTNSGLTPTTASHSTPITVLVELGLVGLLALAAVAAAVVRTAVRATRVDGPAAVGLAAALLAVAVHSLLYASFFEDPLTWVFAGLLAALGPAAAATARSQDPPPVEAPVAS